jgi:hypothetical protein
MTSRLHPLRHDDVRARHLGRKGFGNGRDAGEPGDAARLQAGDEIRGVETHDRGDDGRSAETDE